MSEQSDPMRFIIQTVIENDARVNALEHRAWWLLLIAVFQMIALAVLVAVLLRGGAL